MYQWKKVWNYIPVDWGTQVGVIENLTQKVWIRNNLKGSQVRVQFCNPYDTDALELDAVTIGKWDKETGKIQELREVTCRGKRIIRILPGNSFYSDGIALPVKETDDLVISIYVKKQHAFYGLCQTWNARSFRSVFMDGDQTEREGLEGKKTVEVFPFFGYDENVCNGAVGICGLQVMTADEVTTVTCFGDSITHMSYYFDPLMEELYRRYPGKITLLNCGIGGNRILYDACYAKDIPGHGKCFGDAGKKRFERDVYGDVIPDVIFFLEGINDCTHGFAFGVPGEIPDGEALFAGIKEIVNIAHQKNSKIYISTVMPFGCYEDSFREKAEEIRQDLNGLIRKNREIADGFLDLDQIMRKSENIPLMKDGMHLGDGVHPNEAGGREIAAAIVEKWF